MSSGFSETQKTDIAHVIHPFTDMETHESKGPLVLERGEGVYVYDEHGNQYLDAMSALWCTGLGYSEERLVNVLHAQMKKLPFYHIFNNKAHLPGAKLAEKLTEIAPHSAHDGPMHKVFFANSGSEANDSAIKMVWFYNNALGRTQKKKIISRMRAYHGTTIASGSLTGQTHVHEGFDLPLPMMLHTDCPHYYRFAHEGESEDEFVARLVQNLENLILKENPDTIGAFIAEPIMGAGGVIVPPENYFREIQKVLRKYDILMIADEVITGFCRTGKYFGCELYGIEPDMLTFAKGMSSAYQPISAILMTKPIFEKIREYSYKFRTFAHGFTNSAHPAATAVAMEALKIYEERDIVGHVAATAPYLHEKLREFEDHPLIGDVRGVGFLGGLELVEDKKTKQPFDLNREIGLGIMQAAQDVGLIIRSMDDVLVFCPPLIFTKDHIDEAIEKFKKVMDEVKV